MTAMCKDTDSYKTIERMAPAEVEMMVKTWESIKHTVNGVDPERVVGWDKDNEAAWFASVYKTVEQLPGHVMSNHRDRKRNGFKYRSRAGFVRRVRKDLDKVRDWIDGNNDGSEWVAGVITEVEKMVGYLPHNAPGVMDDEDAMFYYDSVNRVLGCLDEWKVENL